MGYYLFSVLKIILFLAEVPFSCVYALGYMFPQELCIEDRPGYVVSEFYGFNPG